MARYSDDQTFTLEDLRSWDYAGVSLAVVGHPVRHSISPAMHNAALARLAETDRAFSNWRYFRFDIEAERLAEALPLFLQCGFFGLNLTVPHKEVAFGLLSEIDDHARPIKAVNTLRRQDSGYKGFNTDGYGLSCGIRETLGLSLKGADIALLGAGGAARAAAAQCLAEGCRSLRIVNRNQERLGRLVAELKAMADAANVEVIPLAPGQINSLPDGALLINATSLGLKADDPLPLPKSNLPAEPNLYDMIYNPKRTALMDAALEAGGRAANGLSMLVHQGAKALEIWTARPAPVEAMDAAARAALSV